MNRQEAINNIMDYFNFELAWKMMQCNPTFWIHAEGGCTGRLREWCREFMEARIPAKFDGESSNTESITTGGFELEYILEPDGKFFIELKFVGESWDNHY